MRTGRQCDRPGRRCVFLAGHSNVLKNARCISTFAQFDQNGHSRAGWWNGRFLTIPLEDFFYNYSLLSLYLLAYLMLKRRFPADEKAAPAGR